MHWEFRHYASEVTPRAARSVDCQTERYRHAFLNLVLAPLYTLHTLEVPPLSIRCLGANQTNKSSPSVSNACSWQFRHSLAFARCQTSSTCFPNITISPGISTHTPSPLTYCHHSPFPPPKTVAESLLPGFPLCASYARVLQSSQTLDEWPSPGIAVSGDAKVSAQAVCSDAD